MLFGSKSPLNVGAEAPRLEVTIESGEKINLGSLYDQGPTLIYFYPRSFTSGCTAQACNLRDNYDAIKEAGINVLGVSKDKVETQARFKAEENLPFSLVADEDGALGKAFQVGGFLGLAYQRQSFLIVDGKIAWQDLRASPSTQTQDAVAALKALHPTE